MSKREQVNLVENMIENQRNLNEFNQERVNEVAPKPIESEPQELTLKQIAKNENVQYIEPKKQIKGLGILPDSLKKEHAFMWEYVKGIFENRAIVGETLKFWLKLYPGDPDCLWEIPANRPVYVPRMVAKTIDETMIYHKFDYIQKDTSRMAKNNFAEEFSVVETVRRGEFRPIGAF